MTHRTLHSWCLVAVCCSTLLGCATPNSALRNQQLDNNVTREETAAVVVPSRSIATRTQRALRDVRHSACVAADTVVFVGIGSFVLTAGIIAGQPIAAIEFLVNEYVPPFQTLNSSGMFD